jgi:cobalamin biosynthesis Mg chelatase CobN
MEYIIQAGDTPSKLAKRFVGKEGRWPEFCKANPQFKKHATYGCVFYVGNKAKLPDSWVTVDPTTGQAVPAVAAPAAAAATTSTGPVVETPVGPATQEQVEASAGMSKVVLIGAAAVAVLIVGAYAMKRKAQAA